MSGLSTLNSGPSKIIIDKTHISFEPSSSGSVRVSYDNSNNVILRILLRNVRYTTKCSGNNTYSITYIFNLDPVVKDILTKYNNYNYITDIGNCNLRGSVAARGSIMIDSDKKYGLLPGSFNANSNSSPSQGSYNIPISITFTMASPGSIYCNQSVYTSSTTSFRNYFADFEFVVKGTPIQ